MKRKMKILAVAMCAGIFAACTSTTTASDSGDADKTDVTETDSAETEEATTETQAEPEQDVIEEADEATGESKSVPPNLDDLQEADEVIIAQVHELTENSTLMLYLYGPETGCEDYVITDYASVDFDNYVYTFGTMEYAIRDTVSIHVVKDGVLSPATAFDIGVDDMLVIYHDEEGVECIAVYQSTQNAI